MERFHPLWSPAKHQAYTEAALLASAVGAEDKLTPRSIVRKLSPESAEYVMQLAHGHDEHPGQGFLEDLHRDEIITYDKEAHRYDVGTIGRELVNVWLEEHASNP